MKTCKLCYCSMRWATVLLLFLQISTSGQSGLPTAAGTQHAQHQRRREDAAPLVAVSPDGNSEAVAMPNGRILYRKRGGADRAVQTLYACGPQALVFSTDGTVLACSGAGNCCGAPDRATIRIWFLSTHRWTEINLSGKDVDAITVSPSRVAICSRSEIRCFNLVDGKPAWTRPMHAGICELKFSNDGTKVLASFIDGTTRDYAAETGMWHK